MTLLRINVLIFSIIFSANCVALESFTAFKNQVFDAASDLKNKVSAGSDRIKTCMQHGRDYSKQVASIVHSKTADAKAFMHNGFDASKQVASSMQDKAQRTGAFAQERYQSSKQFAKNVYESKFFMPAVIASGCVAFANVYKQNVTYAAEHAQGLFQTSKQTAARGIAGLVQATRLAAIGSAASVAAGVVFVPCKWARAKCKESGYCLTKEERNIVKLVEEGNSQKAWKKYIVYCDKKENKLLPTINEHHFREHLLDEAVKYKDRYLIEDLLLDKYPNLAYETVGKQRKIELIILSMLDSNSTVKQTRDVYQSILDHPEVAKRDPSRNYFNMDRFYTI